MIKFIATFLLFIVGAFAQSPVVGEYSGNCAQGNSFVTTAAIISTSKVMGSFPGCTAAVYVTNSSPATLATIYTDSYNRTVAANPFTANSDGSFQIFTSVPIIDIQLSGGGIVSPFTLGAQNVIFSGSPPPLSILSPPCKAVMSNTIDNTTAISVCMGFAAAAGVPMYIPAGTFLSCGASYTGTGNITIFGGGMTASMLQPFGGSAACNSPILAITTTSAVTLHDFGTDGLNTIPQQFTASNIVIGGTGSADQLVGPSSVTLYNLYTARSKSVGIGCQPCQNVSYTNSTSYRNYWFGASFASSGTTASPLYLHNINIHGITSIDEAIGVGISFFLSNISVTGNVFRQSGLELVQTPHAQATIEGNSFDGVPDQGCIVASGMNSCGSVSGIWAPLYLEGASDWTIGVNHLANINGSAAVLNASGSTLTIPSNGTQMELPTSHGHVDGLVIENSSAGFPILIGGESNGENPVLGVDVSVKNVKLSNVNECPTVNSVIGIDVGNNFCNGALNGGYTLGNIQSGAFYGNTGRNVNTAGGTTYSIGTLSATNGSATLTGSGTTWISGMALGGITIYPCAGCSGYTATIGSFSSTTSIALTVPYAGTSGTGLTYSIYYGGGGSFAGLQINGTGTHALQINGNTFQNDSGNSVAAGIADGTGLTAANSLITYGADNICSGACANGIYTPPPGSTPTPVVLPAFSCGSGGSIASYSTNTYGLLLCGSTTTFSLTFAGDGFTQTPTCNFTDSNGDVFAVTAGSSGTVFNGASNNNLNGFAVTYSCSGVLVNRGQYPYPIFWR